MTSRRGRFSKSCNTASAGRRREEVEAREAAGQKWFSETGGVVSGEVILLEEGLANLRAKFTRCEGVTDAMHTRARELLAASAERGDRMSQYLYAQALQRTNEPQLAHEQLKELWEDEGYVYALGAMGQLSLPHRIAWLSLEIALNDGLPGEMFQKRFESASERLQQIEHSTSIPKHRAAVDEAARILRNPRCCKI